MAARKPPDDERNDLVLRELEHIRETTNRLEAMIATHGAFLDRVRVTELASIRANLSDATSQLTNRIALAESDLKLLRYQMSRTTAAWSLISGGVASAIVAAVMALLLRH